MNTLIALAMVMSMLSMVLSLATCAFAQGHHRLQQRSWRR